MHPVEISFREDRAVGLLERTPAVVLAGPAANVRLNLEVPSNRWLLWVGGPRWGSVVALWLYLPVLVLAAWALARLAPTPLGFGQWLLLGLGLTQIPLAGAVVVVVWFIAFATRDRWRSRRWWLYDAQQLFLAFCWLLAVVALYAAVYSGLLGQPDMELSGSSGSTLTFFQDQTGAPGAAQAGVPLPRAYAVWLPLWVFRVLMMLWALWLSARMMRWFPWAWKRLTEGPLLAGPRTFDAPPAAP
jgi:hypothetical protein